MSRATRHLFVATARGAFGEALLGRELARALAADGDEITFLHPSTLETLFAGAPFRRGRLDFAMRELPGALAELVRTQRLETVVLCDVASVLLSLPSAAALRGLPLVGLDLWDLPRTDLLWDVADAHAAIDPLARTIPCLRPAPLARADSEGAYRVERAAPQKGRAATRAALGIAADAPVLLTTTAPWQHPSQHHPPAVARLAAWLPRGLAAVLARLPPQVVWLHVGPEPWPGTRHLPSLPADQFSAVLAASDLLLIPNLAATTIAAALTVGVPVVGAVLPHGGGSRGELEAARGAPLADDVAAALAPVYPLHPARALPLGLWTFLGQVLAGHPLADAVPGLDLLDPDALAARCAELLFDADARADALARGAALLAGLATLPGPLARFRDIRGRA